MSTYAHTDSPKFMFIKDCRNQPNTLGNANTSAPEYWDDVLLPPGCNIQCWESQTHPEVMNRVLNGIASVTNKKVRMSSFTLQAVINAVEAT